MLFLLGLLWSHGSLQRVRAAAPVPASNPPVASGSSSGARSPTVLAPIAATPEPPPMALPQQTLAAEVPPVIIPVQGADPAKILDTFSEGRGNNRHEATDIMAARGTPVVAAADGTVVKLFNSRRGGITIYQFDPTRTWCYYYAHLDHYAPGLAEGAAVHQGQVIGYVGSTGDASPAAPHLHFAIFKLGPEKHWWQGTPVNPYPVLMLHARQ
jgi:murein DD-endopeptidase MepM/ murein hydrolase activator NlpD